MTTHPLRGAAESLNGPTPADAAREIARLGSAVLRGVWAPEPLATLRDAITGFCDNRADVVASGAADAMTRHYHEQGTIVLNWLMYEGRLGLEFLADMFRGSFFEATARAFFDDDRIFMAPERIGARNMRPPHSAATALPFHQDSYNQDRRVRGVLNCWIPLDPGAGTTAPGVEVVRHPGLPGFELRDPGAAATGPSYDSVAIDRDRIVAEYGDSFLAPAFALGDSLVFSQDVIHRTYVTPGMTDPRIGFEFRVFSLKHLAPGAFADEVEAESFPLN